MIDVFYYYFYLGYKNVTFIHSTTPKTTAAWTLGLCLSFWVIEPVDLFIIHHYGILLKPVILYSVSIIFFLTTLYVYLLKGRSRKVIQKKPKLFGSHIFSIVVTVVFFILSLSLLIIGMFVGRKILSGEL